MLWELVTELQLLPCFFAKNMFITQMAAERKRRRPVQKGTVHCVFFGLSPMTSTDGIQKHLVYTSSGVHCLVRTMMGESTSRLSVVT